MAKSYDMENKVTCSDPDKCISSYMEVYVYNVIESKIRSGQCGYSLSYSLVFLNKD